MKPRYIFAILIPTLITAVSIIWYRKRKKIRANPKQILSKQEIMNPQSNEPLQSEEDNIDLNASECLTKLTISDTSHLNCIAHQNNLSSPSLERVSQAKIQAPIEEPLLNVVTEDAADNQNSSQESIVVIEQMATLEAIEPKSSVDLPQDEQVSLEIDAGEIVRNLEEVIVKDLKEIVVEDRKEVAVEDIKEVVIEDLKEVVVKDLEEVENQEEIIIENIEENFDESIQNENQTPPNSDIRSVGSNDSGKGGSDIVYTTEHPIQAAKKLIFEFEIPQELCGRLIGRNGKHINHLKSQSNTLINIKKHPFSPLLNICSIEGTEGDVQMALDLIRTKFPLPQFPVLTMDQVNCNVLPSPESLKLQLPEGMTCDVILSSLVTAGHFFLQQPTHPTHANLCRLDQLMLSCYSNPATPLLPRPVEPGIICAAPIMEGWYRAEVVCSYEHTNECEIKFLDYGGFSRIPTSSLRQIWSDFMTVPFQATECLLANVTPKSENLEWSVDACMFFEELAQGQILQAVIAGYSEEGLPFVHLHRVQGATTIYINKELVLRDFANWIEKVF